MPKDAKMRKKIRKAFIEALYNGIVGDGITLDFIYGADEDGKLLPLDGQQRLTTLYLLHWLAALRENVSEEDKSFLRNFVYETKPDTRFFCELLTQNNIACGVGEISRTICDMPEYALSWNFDLGIQGMLVMLDELDVKFYGTTGKIENLWEKLDKITFYSSCIPNLGLTDDLYIKMNSRGKPLTNFEHFKSRFDKATNSCLANKIDVLWTVFLWRLLSDEKKPQPEIDSAFLNLFHFIASIITLKANEGLAPEDHFMMIEKIFAKSENLGLLEKFFDVWNDCVDADLLFESFLTNNEDDERINVIERELNFLKQICRGNYSLPQIIMLWAFTIYLMNKSAIPERQFRRRLRILRNLTENSRNEIRLENMAQLLSDTEDLIRHEKIQTEKPSFNSSQKLEEKRKLDWLASFEDEHELHTHEANLALLENRNILLGATGAIGTENYHLFDTFIKTFANAAPWNLLTRSLLAMGDCPISETSTRWRFGGNDSASWRSFFYPNEYVSDRRQEFIQIIGKFLNGLRLDNDPQKLIDAYLPAAKKDWRYYVVRYPAISEKSVFAKYYWRDGNLQYDFRSMQTASMINGRNYQALLLPVLEKCRKIMPDASLDNYGGALSFPDASLCLDNFNDCYVLYEVANDGTKTEIKKFPIQQNNGIDQVDRVEHIAAELAHLLPSLSARQSSEQDRP